MSEDRRLFQTVYRSLMRVLYVFVLVASCGSSVFARKVSEGVEMDLCVDVVEPVRREMVYLSLAVGEWNVADVDTSEEIFVTTTNPFGGDVMFQELMVEHYEMMLDVYSMTVSHNGVDYSLKDFCLRGGQVRELSDPNQSSVCMRFSPINGFVEGGFDFPSDMSTTLGLSGDGSLSAIFTKYLGVDVTVTPFDYCLFAKVYKVSYPDYNINFYGDCRPFLKYPSDSDVYMALEEMYVDVSRQVVIAYGQQEFGQTEEEATQWYQDLLDEGGEDAVQDVVEEIYGYRLELPVSSDSEEIRDIVFSERLAHWDGGPDALNVYPYFETSIIVGGVDTTDPSDHYPESVQATYLLNDAATFASNAGLTEADAQAILDTWHQQFTTRTFVDSISYAYPSDVMCTESETPWLNVTIINRESSEDDGFAPASVSVTLSTKPTAAVVLSVLSSDETEGIPRSATIVIEAASWNVPQYIYVDGQADTEDDGDVEYDLHVMLSTTSDPDMKEANPRSTVTLVNLEAQMNSVRITPVVEGSDDGTCHTSEAGTACVVALNLDKWLDTFSMLDVSVSVSDTSEVSVTPTTLLFESLESQQITITGLDDLIIDGTITITIGISSILYIGATPKNMESVSVTVYNADDDTAEMLVTIDGEAKTQESGMTFEAEVVLLSQPTASVTVPIWVPDEYQGEVAVETSSLVFTTSTWNVAQVVTMVGQDDDLVDKNQYFAVHVGPTSSSDPNYNALEHVIEGTNVDDDAGGIEVTKDGVGISSANKVRVSETGGVATFEIRLRTIPTSPVTVLISPSAVGIVEFTPFDPFIFPETDDTSTTVTVAVTPIDNDDFAATGFSSVSLAVSTSSADVEYDGLTWTVPVEMYDDEVVLVKQSSVSTYEAQGACVTLVTPTDDNVGDPCRKTEVEIYLAEWASSIGVVTASVVASTFSTESGVLEPDTCVLKPSATSCSIMLYGSDDNIDDGDISYTVVLASELQIEGEETTKSIADLVVSGVNVDDDVAGVTIIQDGMYTSENGTLTSSFTVSLSAEPTSPVSIVVSSSDGEVADQSNLGEGTPLVFSLGFDWTNWFIPQVVMVVGLDDAEEDGDIEYVITFSKPDTDDTSFSALRKQMFTLVNIDDDRIGFSLTSDTNYTTELGGIVNAELKILSQPTATVLLSVSVSDSTEATSDQSLLAFSPDNWDVAQEIVVRGLDDDISDGDVPYNLEVAVIFTEDSRYAGGNFVITKQLSNVDDNMDKDQDQCDKGYYRNPDYEQATLSDGTVIDVTDRCLPTESGTYTDIYNADVEDIKRCPSGTSGTGSAKQSLQTACAPCEVGYYQSNTGAKSCLRCPEGMHCPLAAVYPRMDDSYALSSGFEHQWQLLYLPEYGFQMLGLKLDEQGLSYFLTVTVNLVTTLMFMALLFLYFFGNRKTWKKTYSLLRKIDQFSFNHSKSHLKEGDALLMVKTGLGGVLSLLYMSVAFAMILAVVISYFSFNEDILQALVPKDDTFAAGIITTYAVNARFLGYSGSCPVTSSDSPSGRIGTETDTFQIVATGVGPTESMTERVYCDDDYGQTLNMEWSCEECYLTGAPIISLRASSEENVPSATAVEWHVETSEIIPAESNVANGTMVPLNDESVFRGSGSSFVVITLIPASYERTVSPTVPKTPGFRIQFSSEGSGTTTTADNFYDDGANEVSFIANLELGSFQLESLVTAKRSVVDVIGAVGGLHASVRIMFIMMLLVWEKYKWYGPKAYSFLFEKKNPYEIKNYDFRSNMKNKVFHLLPQKEEEDESMLRRYREPEPEPEPKRRMPDLMQLPPDLEDEHQQVRSDSRSISGEDAQSATTFLPSLEPVDGADFSGMGIEWEGSQASDVRKPSAVNSVRSYVPSSNRSHVPSLRTTHVPKEAFGPVSGRSTARSGLDRSSPRQLSARSDRVRQADVSARSTGSNPDYLMSLLQEAPAGENRPMPMAMPVPMAIDEEDSPPGSPVSFHDPADENLPATPFSPVSTPLEYPQSPDTHGSPGRKGVAPPAKRLPALDQDMLSATARSHISVASGASQMSILTTATPSRRQLPGLEPVPEAPSPSQKKIGKSKRAK
eukprot:Rmarinus@m.15406